MYLRLIGMTLLLSTCSVTVFQQFDSEKCKPIDEWKYSQPKLCVEDVDHQIYPGRIKTLLLNLYIPRGLKQKASINIGTPADKSVIITNAFLAFQDDYTNATNETWISRNHVHEAVYLLGDIHCRGSRNLASTATKSSTDTESTKALNRTASTESVNTENTTFPDNRETTAFPVNTETTVSYVNTTSTNSPANKKSPNDTESPTNTESTKSPNNTVSRESPNNTEYTESLNNTASTESPNNTSSTEFPNNTKSTESQVYEESTESTNIGEYCDCCLLQFALEVLMVNTIGILDNSTRNVSASFIWDTGKIYVITKLVLKTLHNSSTEPSFSTDIPDLKEVPLSSVNTFQIQAFFSNPLSTYSIVLVSPDKRLRIASVLIEDHCKGIISTPNNVSNDDLFCSQGPDTRVVDFGYLPNQGTRKFRTCFHRMYGSDTSTINNTIDFEVILLMSEEATPGETYPFVIYLKMDSVVTQNTTKYFKASEWVSMKKPVVNQRQTLSSLPVGGTSSVTLTVEIPPLSSGHYQITASSKNNESSLDGLSILLISVDAGSNLRCIPKYKAWKGTSSKSLNITNAPNTKGSISDENMLDFKVSVLAIPESVTALSTCKLTVNLTYPGEGSPQVFEFYFNITDEEIKVIPGKILIGPLCADPLTFSNTLTMFWETQLYQAYGTFHVEIPVPSESVRQSFALCRDVYIVKSPNIFGRISKNITRGTDGKIEKILLEISTLTNIGFERITASHPNYLNIFILVTYTDTSLIINNDLSKPFPIRISRNDKTILEYNRELPRPFIKHYPDFIVLTKLQNASSDIQDDVWFHYSQDGSHYHRVAMPANGTNDLSWSDRPKLIAYYYFSSSPCTVVCNIVPVWKPLKHYFTIVNDKNNTILRMFRYAVDQDLDTCIALPVPGNSPSMFWLRIKDLSFFKVSSKQFFVHITGKGIACKRFGLKSLQVGTSGLPYSNECSMESDMVFCKLVSENTNATLTQCNMECKCDDRKQCSNVHIIMQSTNKDVWSLCEITVNKK